MQMEAIHFRSPVSPQANGLTRPFLPPCCYQTKGNVRCARCPAAAGPKNKLGQSTAVFKRTRAPRRFSVVQCDSRLGNGRNAPCASPVRRRSHGSFPSMPWCAADPLNFRRLFLYSVLSVSVTASGRRRSHNRYVVTLTRPLNTKAGRLDLNRQAHLLRGVRRPSHDQERAAKWSRLRAGSNAAERHGSPGMAAIGTHAGSL